MVRQKPFWTDLNCFGHICLVLLCNQNSLGRSKMVLVWPNLFGLHHNDLVITKVKWSRPKWIGQVKMGFILVENHNLDLTNSFWSRPNHYGQVQINLVRPKPFCTDQNCFGHIEGQGIKVLKYPKNCRLHATLIQKVFKKNLNRLNCTYNDFLDFLPKS